MTVSLNTIAAENIGQFCKFIGEKGLNFSKKMTKSVCKNPEKLWKMVKTLVALLLSRTLKQFYQPNQK